MIGVLGAYGEVGSQAARCLQNMGYEVKLGGRQPEKMKSESLADLAKATWQTVDLYDASALDDFMAGCELVINCAGPAVKTSLPVMASAMRLGTALIDTGHELPVSPATQAAHTIIYGAGSTPGLSGLLPLWLAQGLETVTDFKYYYAALAGFSRAAAEDYLAGIYAEDNEFVGNWEQGQFVSGVPRAAVPQELPYFATASAWYPFFDRECLAVAQRLQLEQGAWYMAVPGEYTKKLLSSAKTQFQTARAEVIDKLCVASQLDAAGKHNYINFLLEVTGTKDEQTHTRSLILQAPEPAQLTGTVAALTAVAYQEKELPSGVYPLFSADFKPIMTRLATMDFLSAFQVLEQPLLAWSTAEEGEI